MSAEHVSCRGGLALERGEMRSAAAIAFQTANCGRVDRPGPQDTAALLAKMVQGQIIPRLMRAHKPHPTPAHDGGLDLGPGARFTDAFALMVLSNEVDELLKYVRQLMKSVLTSEFLYFEFLTAVARRLGDYWNDDAISLAEVTIGLGRLQQVVRKLDLKAHDAMHDGAADRSALFASCEGQTESFGLALVDDFFYRAGWHTCVEPSASCGQIETAVGRRWFDLFGLSANCSVSCDAQLEAVASTIISVRRVSRNRDITVIVGGRLFHEHPELASTVGADATACGESVALLAV